MCRAAAGHDQPIACAEKMGLTVAHSVTARATVQPGKARRRTRIASDPGCHDTGKCSSDYYKLHIQWICIALWLFEEKVPALIRVNVRDLIFSL